MKSLEQLFTDLKNENQFEMFVREMKAKGYYVKFTWSGSIAIYPLGKKDCLKNLVCMIHGKDYTDYGPNERLRYIIEPCIKKLMSNI